MTIALCHGEAAGGFDERCEDRRGSPAGMSAGASVRASAGLSNDLADVDLKKLAAALAFAVVAALDFSSSRRICSTVRRFRGFTSLPFPLDQWMTTTF